jgi:hypothetical protein
MNKNRYYEFEKWYEEYFGTAQGEDSPYSYNDVKIAFLTGWKICKKEKENKEQWKKKN